MAFTDDDLLPISALQHLLFCERQCALIHIERLWVENRYTAEGQSLNRRAHDGKSQTRDGVRITRGLSLASYRFGLIGQADVVEFRPPANLSLHEQNRSLASLLRQTTATGLTGWSVTPIEYKRGKPKQNDCDRVQLCAQALCLEEMLQVEVPVGLLFYGLRRQRYEVGFDGDLRRTTIAAADRLHQLIRSGRTPTAVRERKCDTCSLLPVCLPDALTGVSARNHFERQLAGSLSESIAGHPSSDQQ